MWRSLSITIKLIMCLSILILGYFFSMIYVYSTGKQVEKRLEYVSYTSFPASLKSQSAINLFKEQLRLYRESVMLGETSYIDDARNSSDKLLDVLTSIKQFRSISQARVRDISRLSDRLKAFTVSAGDIYSKMAIQQQVDYKTIQSIVATSRDIENKLIALNMQCEEGLKSDLVLANKKIKDQDLYNMVAFFAFLIMSVTVMWLIITRSIIRPLRQTVSALREISQGNLSVRLSTGNDEIGDMGKTLNAMVASLDKKVRVATEIAHGNLNVDLDVVSENDSLGKALKTMISSLNQMASGLLESADRVEMGARQVAESSEELTCETMEQSSSLEQATAAMASIGFQTRKNAEHAIQANQQTEEAFNAAINGSERMKEMVTAMDYISESTDQIEKINKTIDEIAFQINLLSLNAAIEAARAGKNGKGFAVVAQEVRNLAMRSARAVQETSVLIDSAVKNVTHGNRIAKRTSDSFSDIHAHIATAANLVSQIASLSQDQAHAISQTNDGLAQIVNSTQKNSAAAVETSSAADELSSQASYVRALINRFQIKQAIQNKPGNDEDVCYDRSTRLRR